MVSTVQYRPYGKSGIQVSALGFGAMRLPKDEDYAVQCMVRSLELGVNYIDTAHGYNDGWSEQMVGRAAKQFGRDKVFLATKNPMHDDTADGWWRRMEQSLERLDTDHIDFYKIVHSLGWESWERFSKPGGPIDAMKRAQEQGLFSHCIFSTHDSPENIMKLIDEGVFEGMLIQYNLLDRRYEDAIAHAHESGMGVEIMGPVGGGRLGAASEKLQGLIQAASTPELETNSVWPSAGALAAISAPMLPDAPARLSITTGWPSESPRRLPTARHSRPPRARSFLRASWLTTRRPTWLMKAMPALHE